LLDDLHSTLESVSSSLLLHHTLGNDGFHSSHHFGLGEWLLSSEGETSSSLFELLDSVEFLSVLDELMDSTITSVAFSLGLSDLTLELSLDLFLLLDD
jgi:hypothetical protein